MHCSKYSLLFSLYSSTNESTLLNLPSSAFDAEKISSALICEFSFSTSKYIFFILVKYSLIVFSTIAYSY